MIPDGYANALHAWATSPEQTDEVLAARVASLLTERDALVSGVLSGGKTLADLTQGGLNGKTFTWDPCITKAEKLPILTDVLTRLGKVAPAARLVTTTHANFSALER